MSSDNNRMDRLNDSSIELSMYNLDNMSLDEDIDADSNELVYRQQYPVNGIKFTGERVLKTPDYIYNICKSKAYTMFAIIFLPIWILLVISSVFDNVSVALQICMVMPICIIVILELQFFDRFLMKRIFTSFNFWFMFGFINLHVISTIIHYTQTEQHISDVHIKDSRKVLYRSVPIFFIGYIITLLFDAHIYRSRNSTGLKVALGIVFLNGIRYFLANQFWDRHADIEQYEICLLECTTSQSIRSSTMFVLTLFFGRMLLLVITSDRALILTATFSLTKKDARVLMNNRAEAHDNTSSDKLKTLEPPIPMVLLGDQNQIFILNNSANDMLLRINVFNRIGSTKYYVIFVIIWICFVIGVTELGLNHLPVIFWLLLNLVNIFVVCVECATRWNRYLFFAVWKRFEAWYLLLWSIVWGFCGMYRSLKREQPWESTSGTYFLPPTLILTCLAIISLDCEQESLKIKRLIIVAFFVFLCVRSVTIRLSPANQAAVCLIWCSDTGSLEQGAWSNLFIFSLKFLYFVIFRPKELLILKSYLRALPVNEAKFDASNETETH